MNLGPFTDNDQGMFKLSSSWRIETEITLQRNFNINSVRNIDKGAAGPNSAMQSGKLVICRRNKLHEVTLDDIFIFLKCRIKICIDNALLDKVFLDAVINDFRIILGTYTRKGSLFRFRNAQTVKGILDIIRNVVPVRLHLRIRTDIGDDIGHIKTADIRAPHRVRHLIVDIKRFQAEVAHPFRLILLFGNLLDDVRCQASIGLIGILEVIPEVIHVSEIVDGIENLLFLVQSGSLFFRHNAHLPISSYRRRSRFPRSHG